MLSRIGRRARGGLREIPTITRKISHPNPCSSKLGGNGHGRRAAVWPPPPAGPTRAPGPRRGTGMIGFEVEISLLVTDNHGAALPGDSDLARCNPFALKLVSDRRHGHSNIEFV